MNHRFRIIAGQGGGPRKEKSTGRRSAERFPVLPEKVQVRTTQVAKLTDESFEGVGLIVDDAAHLEVGQTIELEDAEHAHPVEGVIVHLTFTEDGKWKVGINLDDSYVPI
jgi:hypothetical protein